METARTLALGLAFVLALSLAGCGALQDSGTPDGPGTPDGATIANETAAGIDAIDGYTYDSTVTASRNGTTSTVNVTGTVDRADRRLHFRQDSGDETSVQYVVDDTIYVRSGGDWSSRSLGNGSFWTDGLPLGEQRSILERANVSDARTGTVDGTDVYVLDVTVSERQLRDYLAQRLGFGFVSNVTFSDVSYRAHVTQEDHRLVRVTTETTVSYRGQALDVSTTLNLGGYDEPVTVELPDEIDAAS